MNTYPGYSIPMITLSQIEEALTVHAYTPGLYGRARCGCGVALMGWDGYRSHIEAKIADLAIAASATRMINQYLHDPPTTKKGPRRGT